MTNPIRNDEPDALHHCYNRGVGKRAVFEDEEAVSVFGGLLRREVRLGRIQVLAYCFMVTHFHLVLLSLLGELSAVMQRVESCFTRWFNRRHDRDGPLFRSRFGSRRVMDEFYLNTLIRYVDSNPVAAGIVPIPEEYPHGSARALLRGPRPDWLSTEWLGPELGPWMARGMTFEQAYRYVFSLMNPDEIFLIEQRMACRAEHNHQLDSLVAGASPSLREWFEARAHLADGGVVGAPLVGPGTVGAALGEARTADPVLRVGVTKRRVDAWPVIEVALLRQLCGMTFEQISEQVGCSTATAYARYHRHRAANEQFVDYSSKFADVALRIMSERQQR